MIIIYRGCNAETTSEDFKSNRPEWFSKMNCFRSLINSLCDADAGVAIMLHIILDGDDGPLTTCIEKEISDLANNYPHLRVVIEKIYVKNNAKSLEYVYDTYLTKYAGESVYFVEDDYLHTNEAIAGIFHGIQQFQLITGYDHTDRYTRFDDANYERKIVLGTHTGCHWRTAESTTCTWACDADIALGLVKQAKRFLLEDRAFFRSLINLGIQLYTPMPGMTTHMNKDQLSPFVDWKYISHRNQI